jgi:hypothetical protein
MFSMEILQLLATGGKPSEAKPRNDYRFLYTIVHLQPGRRSLDGSESIRYPKCNAQDRDQL